MNNYKEFFKDKKITIMGLGLLGRGIGDAVFLAECGAKLTITDLKTKAELRESLNRLKKFKDIKYTLGEHDFRDFKNRDMILKAAGVPLDSMYIAEARKNKIPIEMDVSLFAKLATGVKIVGVTGTRGKSMTTAIIYEILKQNQKLLRGKVYIGGNVRGVATLPLLKKVKPGDILVCELDSWQLQGFGEAKISPHISVFTSFMPDHMNYYGSATLTTGQAMKRYFADKANIFKYQKREDILIIRPDMKKLIPKNIKSKLITVSQKNVTKYDFTVPGKYQKENLACAVEVAKQFKIPDRAIAKAIKNFKGLEGRLQYLKTIKGVKIYNDNNATTPEATMAGIEALSVVPKNKKFEKRVVLISGGNDKGIQLDPFVKVVNRYCKQAILIPGTGTDKLMGLRTENQKVKNLRDAVSTAMASATKGDILLFSPAFSSFSQYNNEYERGDEFIKFIKKWK